MANPPSRVLYRSAAVQAQRSGRATSPPLQTGRLAVPTFCGFFAAVDVPGKQAHFLAGLGGDRQRRCSYPQHLQRCTGSRTQPGVRNRASPTSIVYCHGECNEPVCLSILPIGSRGERHNNRRGRSQRPAVCRCTGRVMAASPLVVNMSITRERASRLPPPRSTTLLPRQYTQAAAPSSPPVAHG